MSWTLWGIWMERMMRNEYGTLAIPEEVFMLIRLEEELVREGKSLDTIGLIPIVQEFAYPITPIDVIPFANTGGNGIHFGFLTDFGQITNLNKAPIVCVSPTNDPPIRLVAPTIREFLNMASSVPHVELIETCWPWNDKDMTESILEDYRSDDYQKKRNKLLTRLRETFHTVPVNVAECVHRTLQERNSKIILPTYDGLGVVPLGAIQIARRYDFDPKRSQDEEELTKMRSYLSHANSVEKLGFIRDASYWYILSSDYDDQIMKLVGEILEELQLENEIKRYVNRIEHDLK
jgi:hypothetical protein